MATWTISGILGFMAGGAVVWLFKEPLLTWYKGAEDRIGELNDRIQTLKSKLK